MFTPYIGKEYSENAVKDLLQQHYEGMVLYDQCEDVYREAARAIADGNIIGWFQGRSECGPRALGNRSILADPRDPQMKDRLNAKVKFREAFRPFAPSVLWEHQKEYFELDIPSPYMLMVSDIKPDKRGEIPAVTHVDGTGRLQTVLKNLNECYYRLIEQFYQITGIPIVLNTSFNIRGEPIVETPQDAVRCFMGTGIDLLFIGSWRIRKNLE